jgi:hypothetical protein
MAQAINTGDALASALTFLFGRDADTGAIVEFKTGRALTIAAEVVEGLATPYGRSFRTTGGSPSVLRGVTFPAAVLSTGSPVSIFVVTNGYNGFAASTAGAGVPLFGSGDAALRVGAGLQLQPATGSFCPTASNNVVADATMATAGLTAGSITTGAKSFGYTRGSGGTSAVVKAYINGALDANFVATRTQDTFGGGAWTTAAFAEIGGFPARSAWASFDFVYVAVFSGVTLTEADFTRLHASLTGGNNFALLTAPTVDTSAPVLSSPTATATGSTTASGSVTTDTAEGTLYRLVSTSSTATGTAVKAGLSQTITAAGATAVTFTGLAPSTGYYAHYLHRDAAGNDSAVSTSALFTTSAAAGDTTPPTLTGSITITLLTSSTFTASWPAGADSGGGAITYSFSLDGGATWPVTEWPAPTYNFDALTPGATYALRVRAVDAAGNVSTPALATSVTMLSGGTITSSVLKNNTGTVLASTPVIAFVNNALTGELIVKKTGITSSAGGVVSFLDPALVAGTGYSVRWQVTATGAEGLESLTAV